MRQLQNALFVLTLFAGCAVLAWLLGPLFKVDLKIAMLIAMIVAYLLLCACVELLRYRLRKRIERMPAEERAVLSELAPEFRYLDQPRGSASPRVTTLAGAFAVNGLVLPLMLGPLALLQYGFDIDDPLASALALALGFALAWAWWSIGVTVWRWWATHSRGMPPDEVQWRGEAASLLWPKHHFLEKTELGKLLSRRRAPSR